MSKEKSIVDTLLEELDEATVPYKIWNTEKESIQKATAATREASYGPDTDGGYTKAKKFAKVFYTALGHGGNGDEKQLAAQLRVDLGENYGGFLNLLRRGDIDEANSVMKNAMLRKYTSAKIADVSDRVNELDAENKIEFGKGMLPKVGPDATDYFRIATNPGEVASFLANNRNQIYENFGKQ